MSWAETLRRIHEGDEEGEAYHGPATREILRGVDARRAAARPIPAAHTIWEIVQHVLAWRELVVERLAGGPRREMSDEEDWAVVTDTSDAAWEALLARLDANQQRLLAALEGLDEPREREVEPWLRFLVHHELAHAGQIALLKRG